MSIEVTFDTVEGAELKQTAAGISGKRTGLAKGVGGDLTKVLSASGVPRIGDWYPGTMLVPATAVNVRALSDRNTARIEVEYGSPDAAGYQLDLPDENEPPQIEISTVVVPVQTYCDRKGKQITVRHKFRYATGEHPLFTKPGGSTRAVYVDDVFRGGIVTLANTSKKDVRLLEVTQVGTVQAWEPQTTVRLRRRERRSPGDKSKAFVGRLNYSPIFGDGKRTWLCTELSGTSSDGGRTYAVTYGFQRLGDTADPTIVYHDPETNGPVYAPKWGHGIKRVEALPDAEFRNLHLGI